MNLDEIVSKLEAKIPREHVATRPGGGKSLSYLETWYVIDQMNKIFGNLNWSSDTMTVTGITDAEIPSYVARVRIIVSLADGRVVYKDGMGYGSGKGGKDAHEMAVKEAESDALKRAAMKFGLALGLALYDKTQENVEDAKPSSTTAKRPTAVAAVEPVKAKPASAAVPSASDELGLITQLAKVAEAKKKITIADFKKHYQEAYKVKSTADLNAAQRAEVTEYLKGLVS